MWKEIKCWFKWLKRKLWFAPTEKVREVYHGLKGEKSYMIEISSGRNLYEDRETSRSMDAEIEFTNLYANVNRGEDDTINNKKQEYIRNSTFFDEPEKKNE